MRHIQTYKMQTGLNWIKLTKIPIDSNWLQQKLRFKCTQLIKIRILDKGLK